MSGSTTKPTKPIGVLSARGERARAGLKEAALAVLEREGYHKMRIADVTTEAGVAQGLLPHVRHVHRREQRAQPVGVERLQRPDRIEFDVFGFGQRGPDDELALPTVVELERLQPDVLLMHNTMHDDFIEAMDRYKHADRSFIVFGQDDLMTALPPKNPFSKTVYKDMKQRIRKCLSLADRLIVTTEPLAQALEGMADDIRVVP